MQHSYVSLVMSKDLVVSWISQLKRLLTKCCHYFTILKVPTHCGHYVIMLGCIQMFIRVTVTV